MPAVENMTTSLSRNSLGTIQKSRDRREAPCAGRLFLIFVAVAFYVSYEHIFEYHYHTVDKLISQRRTISGSYTCLIYYQFCGSWPDVTVWQKI